MARRVLLLIAGFPGIGKSHLRDLIEEALGPFHAVSLDEIKEDLYDAHGFEDSTAKAELDAHAVDLFLASIGRAMEAQDQIISEYPFSQKQAPGLEALCARFGYHAVTVRLTADLDVLYDRQRRRDLDPRRHPGHLVDSFRPGDRLEDRENAPQLLTWPVFRERCLVRGYDTFRLGTLIEADTTDFSAVDYPSLVDRIRKAMDESGDIAP